MPTPAIAPPAEHQTERVPPEAQTPRRVSYETYLKLADRNVFIEWVDGEVLFHAMPTHTHQQIVEFLYRLLDSFVRLFDLGLVHIAPYPMRPREGANAREPDLLFLTHEHRHYITNPALEGPADLAVEVVSDDSVTRDYRQKAQEYQAGGVREYWVVEGRTGRQNAVFYQLTPQGEYQQIPTDENGRYHSAVLPGFWLCPAWLWQDPMPDVEKIMVEMCGNVYTQRMIGLLLQEGGAAQAQSMIELLQQHGFLPGEKNKS